MFLSVIILDMNEQEMIFILLIILIICIIFLIGLIIYQNKSNAKLNHQIELNNLAHEQQFKQDIEKSLLEVRLNIYENLNNFNEHLNKNLKQDFTELNSSNNVILRDIEKRLSYSLKNSFEQTESIIVTINEKMAKINESQNTLKDLSKDIVSLNTLLSDKKTRGTFGEIELYTILDNAFGDNENFYVRQFHLSNGSIADAVIYGSNHEKIVVDSKFPLENYHSIYQNNITKSEQEAYRNAFKKDLKKHIDDIANKYLIKNETADIALMFIPAEAIFAEVYGKFPTIVEYSYQKHVYIVSPSTLMAYLTIIKSLYLDKEKDRHVLDIQKEFIKLGDEFKRFKERYDKLSAEFIRLYKEFDELTITTNKIIKRFDAIDQLEDIEVQENEN